MAKKQLPDVDSPLDGYIYTVRGERVMLDSDLAVVYEVTTKALNQAVKRNESRFPPEFSFQLMPDEWNSLRSQFVTLKKGRGQHRKFMPRMFTEHGAIMLAAVLNSDRAVQASIAVVDAFVRLRRVIDANRALARKIDQLAEKVDGHDRAIAVVFHELQQLVAGGGEPEPEPELPKRRIGFRTSKDSRSGKAKTRKQR